LAAIAFSIHFLTVFIYAPIYPAHKARAPSQFFINKENDFHFSHSAAQQQKRAQDHLAGARVVVANFTPLASKRHAYKIISTLMCVYTQKVHKIELEQKVDSSPRTKTACEIYEK